MMWVEKFPDEFERFMEYINDVPIHGNEDMANVDQLQIHCPNAIYPFRLEPYSLDWSVIREEGTGTFKLFQPNKDYWSFV